MLFHSLEFLFLFLPIVIIVFFALNYKHLTKAARIWLVVASLFFYGWWNINYVPLLLISIGFNFFVARCFLFLEPNDSRKKKLLLFGVLSNIFLLAYFKYANFFLDTMNMTLGLDIELLNLALPLAISFFTLQQIAFLIDAYEGISEEKSFLNYFMFVTFFPQLIAGPIVHHKQVMPQFNNRRNVFVDYKNIAKGLFIFSIGLFKKVMIADNLEIISNRGFSSLVDLSFGDAWVSSLAYTFQLYFDFSGYSDMAIGLALLFNIVLPLNFNSPFKAWNIVEFWRRWHITLSNFIRSYVFTPLLLSRKKITFGYSLFSSFIAMFVMGVWHGSGWNYVLFGAIHALAIIIFSVWQKLRLSMTCFVGWFLTFNLINFSLIPVRASNVNDAFIMYGKMLGADGIINSGHEVRLFSNISQCSGDTPYFFCLVENTVIYTMLVVALVTVFYAKNSWEITKNFKPNMKYLFAMFSLFIVPVLYLSRVGEFIYFQF